MKKTILIFFILAGCTAFKAHAQSISQDLVQLELDYQKLAGLKSILKQMYSGYELVDKGYNSVKSISQGNFSLHEAFLDGLMVVSPMVRKYPKVAQIISEQTELVSEYKSAYSTFKQDKNFNPDEISYMIDVYNNLVAGSLQNLSMLTMVMSDNQLRMSDNERLQAIDRVYAAGHDQLTFLRQFNNNTESVAVQRAQQAGDRQTLKTLYGIN
jgi:uncharacterized protein (UPF0297 family)